MRTTVDIDERVLAAARSKAAAEGISLGRAISDIALAALERPTQLPPNFPTLASPTGHLITGELVAAHRDDD